MSRDGAAISVITPTRNYGRFLGDALESVRGQEVVRQHIVQDALSTDMTPDVICRSGSSVVEWYREPDAGQSDALNKAVERATEEWVAWLNADEFYLPGALGTLLTAGVVSGADIVIGDAVFVNEAGEFMRLLPAHRFTRMVLRRYGMFIDTSSMIVRRKTLGSAPFETSLTRVMDWEFLLKLTEAGAVVTYARVPVGAFRIHSSQVTARPNGRERRRRAPSHPGGPEGHEVRTVQARFGLRGGPRDRALGRLAHAGLKVRNGGYYRELRARRLAGLDLRWFASVNGHRNVDSLMALYRTKGTGEAW